MATISANGSRGHHKFTLTVNETNVDRQNNRSTISFSFQMSPIKTGYDWNYSSKYVGCNCNINGKGYSKALYSYNGSSTVTLASGTQVINHNSDGSKTINFSFNISDNIGASYTTGNASASGSLTLTKIARQANLTGADNFNDEGNPRITYSNPAGNTVSSLAACISLTGAKDDVPYRSVSKTGTSYTFNLTDEERTTLRNACTTSNSLAVKFYLRTMIGSAVYMSVLNRTMTIINGNPIFTDFTYKDINPKSIGITGNDQVLIKNISNLQATILADNKMTTVKSATPKNYNISIDTINKSVEYSDTDLVVDLGAINNSGIQRLNVRAYDSRNNSVVVSKDIQIYDYTNPTIEASIKRTNNWENESTLKVSGKYSRILIDNVDKNTIASGNYRYKPQNGSWSEWQPLTITANEGSYTCQDVILNLDNTQEFLIEVKIDDQLDTVSTTLTLDVGESIFFISSNQKKCFINNDEVVTQAVINELFRIENITINIGKLAVNGEQYTGTPYTIPDGYKPLGLIGYNLYGTYSTWCCIAKMYCDNENIYYSVHNFSGTVTGELSLVVNVLCVKI